MTQIKTTSTVEYRGLLGLIHTEIFTLRRPRDFSILQEEKDYVHLYKALWVNKQIDPNHKVFNRTLRLVSLFLEHTHTDEM